MEHNVHNWRIRFLELSMGGDGAEDYQVQQAIQNNQNVSSSVEAYLVQQAIQHNQTAFSSLYDIWVGKVYRHVYYRVPSQADAEDITQEVFVKAWEAIGKYKKTEAPFLSWLIIIASHLIADFYRRRKKITMIGEEYKRNPGNLVTDPEEQAEINFNSGLVREAVSKLRGDKQRVILMHFIDGFNYEEIAMALNKREGSIRVIQYRALSDLKKLLKRD